MRYHVTLVGHVPVRDTQLESKVSVNVLSVSGHMLLEIDSLKKSSFKQRATHVFLHVSLEQYDSYFIRNMSIKLY